MRRNRQSKIIAFLSLLSIFAIGVFGLFGLNVMGHAEMSQCPLLFLFGTNCSTTNNAMVSILQHVSGLQNLMLASAHTDISFLWFISLFFFGLAAFVLWHREKIILPLPFFQKKYLSAPPLFMPNEPLLYWLALHNKQHPSSVTISGT
ncbi:MAG: hypothetical protein HYT28_01270 [Parcubacteria group bacterium]|nr:hypothetical protein [Parcubacteria group bacterium]